MIEEQHINFDFIIRYIRDLVTDDVIKLYDFAMDKNIPVAKPETTKLLYLLATIKRPKEVLEIGTGIGCSAVILSKAIGDNAHITTIEKNPDNYAEAIKLFEENALANKISIINGDGFDVLKELSETDKKYGFIFLDSAKAQYLSYFDFLVNLLDEGGVLVVDNVLFRGMTASDDLIDDRSKTIVKRLRLFLDKLSNSPVLDTVVIPIGDGVSLSIKK